MSRYIDANKIDYSVYSLYDGEDLEGNTLYRRSAIAFESDIDEIPTADVIEIPESGIGDLSDGYHTFNELYHHRAILFSVICNLFPNKAWKSKLHDTGDMYDGMFVVGIETPKGQATYHYDIDPYWDIFNVKELEKAPKWDGHTPKEAIERITTLSASDVAPAKHGKWKWGYSCGQYGIWCTNCGAGWVNSENAEWIAFEHNYCPKCGAKMKGGAE